MDSKGGRVQGSQRALQYHLLAPIRIVQESKILTTQVKIQCPHGSRA